LKLPADGGLEDHIEFIVISSLAIYGRDVMTALTESKVDAICYVQDGYLFRLTVGFNHEIVLHKKQVLPDGKQKLATNEESAELEYQYLVLPRLTSSLHG
jgi:hypothetical protein